MTSLHQDQVSFTQAFRLAVDLDLELLGTPRIEKWKTKKLATQAADGCQFCGSDAGPFELVHFISPHVGGPHALENLLAACPECAARAKRIDWLAWRGKAKNLATALAAQRLDVIAHAENHLLRTREEARTKPYLLRLMRARWQHPRFVVRAAVSQLGGLLAFPKRTPMPEGIAMLVCLHGGSPVAGAHRIFAVPQDCFLDLVWLLIDHGAWVRRVEVDGFPDPTPPDDGPSRWWETYTSVDDLVRRRKSRRGSVPISWIEKPMDPLSRIHLAGLLALRSGEAVDHNWLARHRETDDLHLVNQRKRRT